MDNNKVTYEQAIISLPHTQWNEARHDAAGAADALEQGQILFFPHLSFPLTADESSLLDPAMVDAKRKNISFQPLSQQLKGVASTAQSPAIRQLLERYYQLSCQLVAAVLPAYQQVLHSPANTLRLHPITAWCDNTSWRKDDSRLHVDAFPSRPTQGERILRIFTNINPAGQNRSWRVGESFATLAQRFLPRLKHYSPIGSWVQYRLGITKTRRSHYDHLMLQLHDTMKADRDYQQQGPQLAIAFPPGSSWICFSDQTPHAAMSGQFMLEQTFLLAPLSMLDPGRSPLKVLESLLHQPLV